MRARNILKPKSKKNIYQELKEAPRDEQIKSIVNLISETDDHYDFLEGFLVQKFSDDIWKKMAKTFMEFDRDESTGRYTSLDHYDRLDLKRKPYEWFTSGMYGDDADVTQAFLEELTDEELDIVVDELIKNNE